MRRSNWKDGPQWEAFLRQNTWFIDWDHLRKVVLIDQAVLGPSTPQTYFFPGFVCFSFFSFPRHGLKSSPLQRGSHTRFSRDLKYNRKYMNSLMPPICLPTAWHLSLCHPLIICLPSPCHLPDICLPSPCHLPAIPLSSAYHPLVICLPSPCHLPDICLPSPCHLPAIPLASAWHLPSIYLRDLSSACHPLVICLPSPFYLPDICLTSAWHLPGICLLSTSGSSHWCFFRLID